MAEYHPTLEEHLDLSHRRMGAVADFELNFADDFLAPTLDSRWGLFKGEPGGVPQGQWDTSHVVLANSIMDIQTYWDVSSQSRSPTFSGWVSGGIGCYGALQTYGKYEICMRSDNNIPQTFQDGYYGGADCLAYLFPDSGDPEPWPTAGEYDWYEDSGNRSQFNATYHWLSSNAQRFVSYTPTSGTDATNWHVWGIEWYPTFCNLTRDGVTWGKWSNGDPQNGNGSGNDVVIANQNQFFTIMTQYNGSAASGTAVNHYETDWVCQWSYIG